MNLQRNQETCRAIWACVVILALASVGYAEPSSPSNHEHTNRLAQSASPYLLQHAHNPVNWYPWGDEAFERARAEDKPVFLSIGYAACHWCHVMERESFENEELAAVMNEHFIAIKVDREERPDIDEIYMAATIAATGRGGWPMSVFMTPDRRPFLCGTYFPRRDRGGRRGLQDLCVDIAAQWKADRPRLLSQAKELVQQVRNRKRVAGGGTIPTRQTVARSVDRIARGFDPKLGGRRSRSNKFPPTMAMELMLREFATQRVVSKPELIETVETTLTRMADGGIYDHIGGGICRYSTDPRWFAPHFEKMLYDQATVSGVFLSAYQFTGKARYARVARSILDYCVADLQDSRGGFYASRDADSEGEEGEFYVWRRSQIEALLSPDDADLFCSYYNVRPQGNWHRGKNILFVSTEDAAFADAHGMTVDVWRERLERMRRIIFDARAKREAPRLDDKVLVEWNGLLITSLARAYRILDEPKYRVAAERAATFILSEMVRDGQLFRAHRRGKTHISAYASDYANLIEGLITLYETTFDRKWLTAATELNERLIKDFQDVKRGGFFYTATDAEPLLTRSKNARDSVVPSGTSTAVLNLLKLSILLHRPDLKETAERALAAMQTMVARGQLERLQWAVLFYHDKPKEIAIIGDSNAAATKALIDEVYSRYLPNKVVASCPPAEALTPTALPLLERKTLRQGKPAAYVCRDYLCGRPVTAPADLAKQLEAD